jgi:hypothetical protein
LRELGYDVRKFKVSELDDLPFTKHTSVRGPIRTTRRALSIVGAPQPKNVDIPESLRKYAGRKVWETTLGELRKAKKPVFVKSLNTQKAWKGCAIYKVPGNEYGEAVDYPNNYQVLASEIVNLFQETRFYVLNGQILRTQGTPPDDASEAVRNMIKDYKDAPISYGIDIAKLYSDPLYDPGDWDYTLSGEENRTRRAEAEKKYKWVIVEVNDGFSVANFSQVDYADYARMTAARWYEMVGFKTLAQKIASQAKTVVRE